MYQYIYTGIMLLLLLDKAEEKKKKNFSNHSVLICFSWLSALINIFCEDHDHFFQDSLTNGKFKKHLL